MWREQGTGGQWSGLLLQIAGELRVEVYTLPSGRREEQQGLLRCNGASRGAEHGKHDTTTVAGGASEEDVSRGDG